MWWDKYIGIPFIERGRSDAGVDCYGLMLKVYRDELQKELPDFLEHYQTTKDKGVSALIAEEGRRWTQVSRPEPFDAVMMRISGLPWHLGIMTGPRHMLHCSQGVNTVNECIDSMRWKNRVLGYFRHA